MSPKRVVFLLLFIFAIIAKPQGIVAKSEPIKGGYMGTRNIDALPQMVQSGMNLALVKFNNIHWPMLESERKLLAKWANACEKSQIAFMPVINLWGSGEKKWITPQYHLYYDGVEFEQTPCPLEIEVYKNAVHNRMLEIASLSKSMAIAGVVIDLEMYGANLVAFKRFCLCDYCFERFLAGKAVAEPIDINDRYKYLVSSGQLGKYEEFASNWVEQMARQTQEQVHAVAPELVIGATDIEHPKAYNEALARGLGSGNKSVLAIAGPVYLSDYIDYIKKTQDRFSKKNINGKLVVGLWQDKIPPANLAAHYYQCAKESAGYWVYTLETLSKYATWTLPFDKKHYWQAIRKANDELDKLGLNHDYKSKLKPRRFETPVNTVFYKKMTIPTAEYVKIASTIQPKLKPLQLRNINKLLFIAKQGEKINYKVKCHKVRSSKQSHVKVVLLDKNKRILAQERASFAGNAHLRVTAPYSGTYIIAIQTFGNKAEIVKYSHPYSVSAETMAHFFSPPRSLYLYKHSKQFSGKLFFQTDGGGESVTATFKRLNGELLGEYEIFAKHEISLNFMKQTEGEIIELVITPKQPKYYGDVIIKVRSGLEKYISPFKNGLVQVTAN
ncbi:hypothetical protein ACFL3G_08165 [Planctomycetota bacterium]